MYCLQTGALVIVVFMTNSWVPLQPLQPLGGTYIHGTLQQAFWLQCCRSHLTISETLNTCSIMWLTSLGKPFVFCRIYSNSHWGDFQTRIFKYVHCWAWEIQKSHRELVTSCWDSDSLIDSSDFFHQILKSESGKYCFTQVFVSKRFCSVASSLLQSGFVYSLQNISLYSVACTEVVWSWEAYMNVCYVL